MTKAVDPPSMAPSPRLSSQPFGWRFTFPLLLGATLNPINSSMIATALVGIGADMRAGPGADASLISILYVCSAVAQPTMGKLSDAFGPRRVFLAGAGILLLAGLLGTCAPTLHLLLVSRALIGIGTSACYPTAMALVRRRADETGTGVPNQVLGNFSIAGQATAVIGLPLGGLLAGAFGWRAIFAVNIPLAFVSIIFTLVGVAKDAPLPGNVSGKVLTAIDAPGIAFFVGATLSLLLFLSKPASPNWPLGTLFVVLATALVVWERGATTPLIDVRMLAGNLPLARTYLRQTCTYLCTYAVLYGVSQWMEQSRHLGASTTGLVLLPLSLVSIIITRLVSGRGWLRWPLVLAGVALISAAGMMLMINRTSSLPMLICMTLLIGNTNGFSGFGNQAAIYLQSPANDIAVAAGLLRSAVYFGAILSSSLIGITFGSAATDQGLHALAWVIGACGLAATLLTFFDKGIPLVADR